MLDRTFDAAATRIYDQDTQDNGSQLSTPNRFRLIRLSYRYFPILCLGCHGWKTI